MVGWEGRGNEPTQADARVVITERNKATGSDGKPIEMLGREGGSMVLSQTRLRGRIGGSLGSGYKPTGLLRHNGGGGIGVADVSSGTDGDSRPLGWRETVRCSLATETESVDGWTRRTRTVRKKIIHCGTERRGGEPR